MRHRVTAALLVIAMTAGVSDAVDFRVTTKLYEGKRLEPSAEHRILFDDGWVVDLPQVHSRFVTVYDPAAGEVTLLDRHTQVQTVLAIDDLVKITAQARVAAADATNRERLGLDAEVESSDRVIGHMIRFGHFEYHTTTQVPTEQAIATDYGRFVILASRLNLVRRLGAPPFGRMTLSDHLTARGELPLETTLTLHHGEEAAEYRSTHRLEESLSDTDRRRIEEVKGMMKLYQKVAFQQFPSDS